MQAASFSLAEVQYAAGDIRYVYMLPEYSINAL